MSLNVIFGAGAAALAMNEPSNAAGQQQARVHDRDHRVISN
jgi:hypothetical protein